MIAALVWKEYREQRIAWAALAVVGAATLFGLPFLVAPGGLESQSQARDWVAAAVVLVAWAYGLICGAMLLAGEREVGTLPFLDALPGLRGQLWRAKCLAGVLLVVAQAAVLMGLSAAAHLFETSAGAAAMLIGTSGAGLFGLAWGMLFSSLGRSVLNMILVGLAGQLAAAFLFVVPAAFLSALIFQVLGVPAEATMNWSWAAVAAVSIPAALGASALVFTRPDRGRLRPTPQASPARKKTGRIGWAHLFWLTGRQSRVFAAGMAAFSLLLGFLVLTDGVVLWPAATLLVGVLCGATAFADERPGPFRFLGDQRFPLIRLWVVKVGLRFLIAAAAALVVFLPSCAAALGRPAGPGEAIDGRVPFLALVFHSYLPATVCPPELFLTAWLVSGFCAGVLCGLLFRNGLASGVFSLFLGTVLAAVWVPSMLQGGLHAWQLFGPPVLLLLATPFLLRPWSADRIVSWTTTRRLAPFVLLAVLWTAAGLLYRVYEIPDAVPIGDVAAFRASLPTPEQDKAGELIRSACGHFGERAQRPVEAAPGPPHGGPPNEKPVKPSVDSRAADAVVYGWPGDDPDLAAWLNRLFVGDWMQARRDWVQPLEEAADLPPGLVANLRIETIDMPDRVADPARRIAVALAARGLQRQAAGDDEAYVENLRIGLALSRSMRCRAPVMDVVYGRNVEAVLIRGLDPWLEHLNGRPDLLRRALDLVSDYLDKGEDDEADQGMVNYLIARNSVDAPLSWLPDSLAMSGTSDVKDSQAQTEAQMVAVTGLLIPWERQRQERLLRVLFSGRRVQAAIDAVRHSPLLMLAYLTQQPRPIEPEWRCRERATQLALALRCYQAETGRPAEKLDELVPTYLPAVPLDPYDGKPFRYRLSRGEEIEWPAEFAPHGAPPGPPGQPAQLRRIVPGAAVAAPMPAGPPPPPPTRTVLPGQGVLWSVGNDGTDDGGHRQIGSPPDPNLSGEDLIFLVPLPPMGK